MTQIKKAFENAAKDAIFKNFNSVFYALLKTSAELTLTQEINNMNLPTVKAKEIPALRPQMMLERLLTNIETAMEQLFEDAYRKAYAASYNRCYGSAYQKALESINIQSFRPLEAERIAEYLKFNGVPIALHYAVEKIFEAFFAQNLLAKLTAEAPKQKQDDEFFKLVDELSSNTMEKTILAMLELATQKTRALYMASFTKHLITGLLSVYKISNNGKDRLNNAKKQVLSAYITR